MAKSYNHEKINGVCLFTTNSKTDCPSWAISPKSCTGAKNCNICKECYGKKGRFRMPNVVNALNQRFNWFQETSPDIIVDTITKEIDYFGKAYFRTHVVGDFINVRSIKIWTDIAQKMKDIRFWFPTKAYRISSMLPALRNLNKLKNACVRPSAIDFDVDTPEIKGLSAGATAHKDNKPYDNHFNCPGDCSKCRVCWDNEDVKVTYHYH